MQFHCRNCLEPAKSLVRVYGIFSPIKSLRVSIYLIFRRQEVLQVLGNNEEHPYGIPEMRY